MLQRFADEGWAFRCGPFFLYHGHEGHTWFRLFGHGLGWRNRLTAWIPFSERYELQPMLKLGRYNVTRVKPRP